MSDPLSTHPVLTDDARPRIPGSWWLAPVALYAAGMLLTFHPVLFSGFALVSGDLADARLVNYVLEHGYRWLQRRPLHRDLWAPPFFYPEPNVGAYSDVLLSAGPCYWPWRALGFDPLAAFQLCFFTVVSLNYLALYLFAARCLRLGPLPAAFAAFLFTFASPRGVHIGHLQLHVHFYTVLCLYAAYRVLAACEPASRPRSLWVVLFFAGLVGQFYASFYLGWFLALALAVGLAWALPVSAYRARLWAAVRTCPWAWVVGGLVAVVALADMGRHYLAAARRAGYQNADLVHYGIPYLSSWWSRGRGTYFNVTNTLVAHGVLRANDWPDGEHALGVGPATYAAALLGLWYLRRRRVVLILLGAALTLFVCTTALAPGVSLWPYLYRYVPGGAAVRSVGRLALLLLIPISLCAAWAVQRLGVRRPAVALALAVLCVLEQARASGAFPREEHRREMARLRPLVPAGSRAFLLADTRPQSAHAVIVLQVSAMWLSLETAVPTVNGYSGKAPPGWAFEQPRIAGPADEARLKERLNQWLAAHGREGGEWVVHGEAEGGPRVLLLGGP